MSLPYSTSRAVFLGNDVTTRFPFSFTVWQNVELAVTVTDPAGNSSLVQGWQVELSPTGGTLVYEHNHAPLPTGYSLAITRAMPFTQEIDLVSGTRFDAEAIETALDKATAERQQLREALSRAVKLPETSLDTPENLVQNLYTARNEAQAAADNAQTSETNAAASATLAANTVAAGLVSVEAARAGAVADVQAEGAVHIAAATAQAAAAASSADTALAQTTAAATSASAAQAWAESPTSPDPTDSTKKSAKRWAEQAGADATASVALVTAEGTKQVGLVAAEGAAQVARVNALVTTVPAAGGIPQADSNGKLALGWLPSQEYRPDYAIGLLFEMRFGELEAGFVWANGGLITLADYPRFKALVDAGKFAARITTDQAAYPWKFCWAVQDISLYAPNLGGLFIRLGTTAQIYDSEREFGSFQIDEFASHIHSFSAAQALNTNAASSNWRNEATQRTSNTGATGGSETRPKNVSVPYALYLGQPA